jgi:hypothetical protein
LILSGIILEGAFAKGVPKVWDYFSEYFYSGWNAGEAGVSGWVCIGRDGFERESFKWKQRQDLPGGGEKIADLFRYNNSSPAL